VPQFGKFGELVNGRAQNGEHERRPRISLDKTERKSNICDDDDDDINVIGRTNGGRRKNGNEIKRLPSLHRMEKNSPSPLSLIIASSPRVVSPLGCSPSLSL
jgi:hypothetical protein